MKVLIGIAVLFALGSAQQKPQAAGAESYNKACRTCHGPTGAGNPALAKSMKVTMRPLGSKEVQSRSDEELIRQITQGVGKMKPVKNLSKDQLNNIVRFLRTLKP